MSDVSRLLPLTSLRFVAAMMIVGLHASNYFPAAAWMNSLPLQQGVSFFFVLSGFILSHAYSRRSVDYWAFIGARVARLWPAHLLTLLAVLAFIRPDSRQLPGTGFFDPWVVFLSNLTLTHSLVPYVNYTFSWNSVSWSISTEMFFYFAFPFLLIGIEKNWRWKLAAAAGVIVVYAVAARAFGIPATSSVTTELSVFFLTYASPLFRVFEFVLGMAVYVIWRRTPATRKIGTATEIFTAALLVIWIAFGVDLVWPLFAWDPTLNIWYQNAGSTIICAIAIFVFAGGAGLVGRFLSLKPLVWLGEISFALYMCHQIIMKWFKLQEIEGKLVLPNGWLVVAICIVVAAAIHHVVELPAQRNLKRLGRLMRPAPSAPHAQARVPP